MFDGTKAQDRDIMIVFFLTMQNMNYGVSEDVGKQFEN